MDNSIFLNKKEYKKYSEILVKLAQPESLGPVVKDSLGRDIDVAGFPSSTENKAIVDIFAKIEVSEKLIKRLKEYYNIIKRLSNAINSRDINRIQEIAREVSKEEDINNIQRYIIYIYTKIRTLYVYYGSILDENRTFLYNEIKRLSLQNKNAKINNKFIKIAQEVWDENDQQIWKRIQELSSQFTQTGPGKHIQDIINKLAKQLEHDELTESNPFNWDKSIYEVIQDAISFMMGHIAGHMTILNTFKEVAEKYREGMTIDNFESQVKAAVKQLEEEINNYTSSAGGVEEAVAVEATGPTEEAEVVRPGSENTFIFIPGSIYDMKQYSKRQELPKQIKQVMDTVKDSSSTPSDRNIDYIDDNDNFIKIIEKIEKINNIFNNDLQDMTSNTSQGQQGALQNLERVINQIKLKIAYSKIDYLINNDFIDQLITEDIINENQNTFNNLEINTLTEIVKKRKLVVNDINQYIGQVNLVNKLSILNLYKDKNIHINLSSMNLQIDMNNSINLWVTNKIRSVFTYLKNASISSQDKITIMMILFTNCNNFPNSIINIIREIYQICILNPDDKEQIINNFINEQTRQNSTTYQNLYNNLKQLSNNLLTSRIESTSLSNKFIKISHKKEKFRIIYK